MPTKIVVITKTKGYVVAPEKPDIFEREALKEWMPPTAPFESHQMLEMAAWWRNVMKISEAYGPRLIAILSDAGALEPEQDPVQAIKILLKAAGY